MIKLDENKKIVFGDYTDRVDARIYHIRKRKID